jgi:hypothetical protein
MPYSPVANQRKSDSLQQTDCCTSHDAQKPLRMPTKAAEESAETLSLIPSGNNEITKRDSGNDFPVL